MDNYKIYLYVIIFIIWLFNTIRKSAKKNTVPEEAAVPKVQTAEAVKKGPKPLLSQNRPTKSTVTKPVTEKPFKFDDFFDELDKGSIEVPNSEINSPNYRLAAYSESGIDEEETIKLKLQNDRLDALNQRKQRVSLSDEHLQNYSLSSSSSSRNKYEEMLKNPDDLRNALILSEILNRKY